MTAYVFLGPTLSPAQARETLDAVYLPPVTQGDVHRATLRRPSMIGIVDGYFDRVPAVWHKEILWALDQGIPVLGAASMGALRAAELDAFGMEGVGRVYEAFRDGELEDDDEVAVAHGLAEDGHRALSEAMVNIRATLAEAVDAGIVGGDTHDMVVDAAKSLYYADRTYRAAIATAAEAGADRDELARLQVWVADAAVDRKRRDAEALLGVMGERLAEGVAPVATRFTFQYTDFWYDAQRSAGQLELDGEPGDGDAGPQPASSEALIEELRLDPPRYQRVADAALARLLALHHARHEGVEITEQQRQATADTFRRERDLHEPAEARRWMADNDLTTEQTARLMRQEAQVRWAWATTTHPLTEVLPDQLRVSGAYPELVQRARDKARALEAAGYRDVSLAELGVEWDDVLTWYFHERLGTSVPVDVASFAAAHGYADEAHLRRVLAREYAYARTSGDERPATTATATG